MEEIDLAQGTFVENWPHWLRWLLFIPAALLAPIIFIIIQEITTNWFLDLGPNAFYLNWIRALAWGAGTVLVGAMVVPKYQRVVAMIFLVIIAMVSGIALLEQVYHFVLNAFLEDVITVGAAAYATYHIFNGTK